MEHLSNFNITLLIYRKIVIIMLIMIFSIYDIILSTNDSKLNINIPNISIFIPIYNKKKYIKKSINSIQHQTLKNI